MQSIGKVSLGVLGAVVIAACTGFGSWGFHKSSDRDITVTFANSMRFKSGDTLSAGTYRMQVPENSQTPNVTFSKDGKVIATEAAKLVTEQTKNDDTEVDSITQGNVQLVTSIHPAGWTQALVFSRAEKQSSSIK